ncbi:MAG: DsbA family protein [Myxococcales bacterium]
MKNANWIVALVVGAAIGFVAGQAVNKSGGGSSGSAGMAMGSDVGKTPANLPGNYLKEADLPAGTLTGLTDQQKYSVLKSINEKHCTCGCDKDSIAQCRKSDPTCTTAPSLITQAIQLAKQGKSSADIEAALGGGSAPNAPNKPAGPPPSQVRNVAIGDGYAKGAKDAKVTIVEFSDFQCPFCSRVEPTVKQIMDAYGKDVRFVWRNEPLPFHPNAMPAAEAAMAAGAQGKFWEMHDLLFQNQRDLSPANYEKWAKQLGLNMDKFKADLASHKYQAKIKADSDYASSVGANGTPNFFVDGRQIVGAQPFDGFKKLIDEELAKAADLEKKGLHGEALYQAELAENIKSAPSVPPPSAGGAPAPGERKVVDLGHAPVRGAPNAPVTVVMFSDFQCPFCGRVEPTVKQIEDTYGNKVKVVWKNNPLPFHPNAMPAAKAAMAAYKQGKFWEMHDLLFANQRDLSPASYEKWAQQIGLNMDKFKADMASPEIEASIKADVDQARQLGAGGTPNFFIDGLNVVGAQPFDKFKQVIDGEIANAGKNDIGKHPTMMVGKRRQG